LHEITVNPVCLNLETAMDERESERERERERERGRENEDRVLNSSVCCMLHFCFKNFTFEAKFLAIERKS